jgi:hypothetical protein
LNPGRRGSSRERGRKSWCGESRRIRERVRVPTRRNPSEFCCKNAAGWLKCGANPFIGSHNFFMATDRGC